jgi:hypothetical protein
MRLRYLAEKAGGLLCGCRRLIIMVERRHYDANHGALFSTRRN